MANNFHTEAGWLLFGVDGHNGIHWPFVPMWFWKLNLLHPFTMGDKQKPKVLFNGVPSVTHGHEPSKLWPHIGVIPDPLDLMTPIHILFGSHKCWLPRGAVHICGETSTCCVISGSMSLNADCWEYGKWPTSLVDDPGTVQTTPTVMDFLMGAVTLAVDLVIDLAFEVVMKIGGAALKKIGDDLIAPLLKKGDEALEGAAKKADDVLEEGLESAAKQSDEVAEEAAEKGAKDAVDGASDAPVGKCGKAGEPVDVSSGRVINSKTDLSLPGAIPLVWTRHYSSTRALQRTSLGRGGWVHGFEQWIARGEAGITLRDEEGRDVYFQATRLGESTFHRMDRLTLTALDDRTFKVYSHATRLTRHFAPVEPDGKAVLRSIEDAHGNAIKLEYSGARLRRIIDTAGREVRVNMTHGGRIARLEVWVGDSLEQWVDYAYAKMGELSSATDALGYAEKYEYDEDHRMVKLTLKNGVTFHYEYDPETGRATKTWGDDGLYAVTLEYDLEKRVTRLLCDEPRVIHWNEDGIVVREETPDGFVIFTREYDKDLYLVAGSNGAGETFRYEHDGRGNRLRETDPAGNVTTWEYENDLPVLRVGPDGLVTRFEHDALGCLRAVTYPSGLRFALFYDHHGHLSEVRGDEGTLTSFVHDARHNVIEDVDARGAKTIYEYDLSGRPFRRIDALGRITEVNYDRLGRVLAIQRPDGTTTSMAYGPIVSPIKITDATGHVTEMAYAGTGALTQLTQPDGQVWSFKYSAQERLRLIENPRGEIYEFSYDASGHLTGETTFDQRVLQYSYSSAGRLSRITYPDHSYREFEYDRLGNVVREESTDGPISFDRDRMGRILGAVIRQNGREVVTLFERDNLGRVVTEVQDGRRLRYGFDTQGRRASRVMPDGATTEYRYDTLGRLIGLTHNGSEMVFERDMLGRETARRDGVGNFTIRSEYDSMDRIIEQRIEARMPSGGLHQAIMQRLWQYDALGRVKLTEDTRWGATAYNYDAIGQLLETRRGMHREVFAYDASGSIQKMLEGLETTPQQAAEAEAWEIGKGNLLLKTDRATYSYDRRGRRISKEEAGKRTQYVWNVLDWLREVTLPSGERVLFTYDAFGRRVRKEVLDEYGDRRRDIKFLWDGDVLAVDSDAQHGTRCFVHAPGTFVPLLQEDQGEVFSCVVDQVGAPRELLDSQGRVVWSAAHSAWGQLSEYYIDPERARRPGRLIESPFRLLGQYADSETGLCYTRFRYFDAEVGRWCSPDPLGIRGGLNLFGFDGSPTNVSDPRGLSTYTPEDVANLILDSNKKSPLSQANAEQILGSGPVGTTANVAGQGGEGADVLFKNSADEVVAQTEVKSLSSIKKFGAELSDGSDQLTKQLGGSGTVFIQLPQGAGQQDATNAINRFRSQPGRNMADYKNVNLVVADVDGNKLYDGPAGCG